MTDRPHVVALPGSLRDGSYTRLALEHALTEAEEMGANTDHIDLREFDLSVFDADAREAGDVLALKDRIRRADSVLLGTPSYHGSYSSVLKTALDYCGFDEFENTTVGLLSVSGGGFPITPLDHLRSVARALNAWVIPPSGRHPARERQVRERRTRGREFQRPCGDARAAGGGVRIHRTRPALSRKHAKRRCRRLSAG